MIKTPDWIRTLTNILIQDQAMAFLGLSFMLKCLLLSLYCILIYWLIRIVKRFWGEKMSVRANYYTWYALLLCFPLSGLGFNTAAKLPFYDVFSGSMTLAFPDIDGEDIDAIEHALNISNQFFLVAKLLRLLLLVATVAWLVATLVKCLRQIAANIRLQKAIGRQEPFDDRDGLIHKAMEAVGLRRQSIQVVAADFIRSPVSYGVLRKTILLPKDYKSRYSPAEQYLLLLHEMGHLKNHDTVKLQIIDIAACFIWSVRLAKKHIIRDSEILCDNRVLGLSRGEHESYAELMMRECSAQQTVKGLAFSDSYHTIKSRIDAIFSRRPETHRVAAFSVAVAIMLAGSLVYASQHPARWLKEATDGEPIFYKEGEFDVSVLVDDILIAAHMIDFAFEVDGELAEYSPTLSKQTPEYEMVRDTYRYEGNRLTVDKVALYTYLQSYMEQGTLITEVWFSRDGFHYVDTTRDSAAWWHGTGWAAGEVRVYIISISELEQANENDRYVSFTDRMTRDEWIYLFVAHWL